MPLSVLIVNFVYHLVIFNNMAAVFIPENGQIARDIVCLRKILQEQLIVVQLFSQNSFGEAGTTKQSATINLATNAKEE